MTRNWHLIRRILCTLEEREDPRQGVRPDDLPGYAPEVVSYHLRLLIEAGLVHGDCSRIIGAVECRAEALTWEGHEFLDRIRSEQGWQAVIGAARDKGLALSFEVIKAVAGKLVEELL